MFDQTELAKAISTIQSVTPPFIPAEAVAVSNLQLANLREGSATLSWLSEQPATGFVEYGETAALGSFGVDARGYDMTVKSDVLGFEGTAKMLIAYIRSFMKQD